MGPNLNIVKGKVHKRGFFTSLYHSLCIFKLFLEELARARVTPG